MSQDLQARLLGAHKKHGKLSVKKAVAALSSASPALARTLAHIGRHSQNPPESDQSLPALPAEVRAASTSGCKFKCSKYVDHTCQRLLEEGATDITCEQFFLSLVRAGPSPLLSQWLMDGFTSETIQRLLADSAAEVAVQCPTQTHTSRLAVQCPAQTHTSRLAVQCPTQTHTSRLAVQCPAQTHTSRLAVQQHLSDTPQPPKDIFLSYSHSPEFAAEVQQLKKDLQSAGYSVWLDTQDIATGSDWHSAIGDGLFDCRAFVALLSDRYIQSKYCQNELFMVDSMHKPIFPVFLQPVDLSSRAASGVQYAISSLNHVSLHTGYQQALACLLQGLQAAGIHPHTPHPHPSTIPPSQKPLSSYTVSEVCQFVESLEISPHHFQENSIAGSDLLSLTDDDLRTELRLQPLQIRKLRKHMTA